MQEKLINWQDPLILAKKVSDNYDDDLVVLYSGLSKDIKGSKSYIALFVNEQIISDNFAEAKNIIENSNQKYFGYISYEIGAEFENILSNKKSSICLPKIHLSSFSLVFEFDHNKKELKAKYQNQELLDEALSYKEKNNNEKDFAVENIASNFDDKSYLKAISDIKNMIAEGDFYQTNLTRKFFGTFNKKLTKKENFSLFLKLNQLSPANYSSFLNLNNNFIISSSPELFLYAKDDNIISRPIKGTSPRGNTAKEDKINKDYLKNSDKEKAENLMIVDLVRNDLARVCETKTIKVNNLFNINSYQNIHHMSSEICGKITKNNSIFDCIKATFPPGSMTGAPKIKAMEVINNLEKQDRGVYSGCIGIFSKDYINSSVVIRTLITKEDNFEFQVGGGITFGSEEKKELEEIFSKAKSILNLLKIAQK